MNYLYQPSTSLNSINSWKPHIVHALSKTHKTHCNKLFYLFALRVQYVIGWLIKVMCLFLVIYCNIIFLVNISRSHLRLNDIQNVQRPYWEVNILINGTVSQYQNMEQKVKEPWEWGQKHPEEHQTASRYHTPSPFFFFFNLSTKTFTKKQKTICSNVNQQPQNRSVNYEPKTCRAD